MGKMLIILTVSFSVLFGITTLNMMRTNTSMTSHSVREYSNVQAKNHAESGVEYAIMKLYNDTTWTGNYTDNQTPSVAGSFIVTVANTNAVYPDGPDIGARGKLVVSTGYYNGQVVTIRAVVQIYTPPYIPPFLRNALTSEKDLNLWGGINVLDDNNVAWNADIHTNQDLDVRGTNLIEGFGTYTLGETLRPDDAARFFKPNVNPNNASLLDQISRIDIPAFDPTSYIAKADLVYVGNTTLTGTQTVGSLDDPKIILVQGDLNISGSFTGYGVFIVTGNIHVTGNVTLTSVDPLGNNLGMYSANDVIFHSGANATGQILAGRDIIWGGGNILHGLATARGEMKFGGTVDIFYRPATGSLTEPFWVGPIARPMIVSYYQ